ncbi:MAG: transcription-repair coupling factor [Bacteroidota bacterium]
MSDAPIHTSFQSAIQHLADPDLLRTWIEDRSTVELRQLRGSSLSYWVRELIHTKRPLLMVSADPQVSASIASDLTQIDSDLDPLLFPSTHRKPYDKEQVTDLSSSVERADVLDAVQDRKQPLVFTSAEAIAEKLISSAAFHSLTLDISQGEQRTIDSLKETLDSLGYESVRFVAEPGEFASRGGILDIYPYTGEYPVRLEFFGDEIESIREFDPDSQRSIAFLNEARFTPASSSSPEGSRESLLEYLPDDTLLILHEPDLILERLDEIHQQASDIHQKSDEPLPEPDSEWLSSRALHTYPLFVTGTFSEQIGTPDTTLTLNASPHPEINGSFSLLREEIRRRTKEGYDLWICCSTDAQRERFEELLQESRDGFRYRMTTADLHEGFLLPDQKLGLLTDHQIFNRYHRPALKKKRRVRGGLSFKELRDLNVGDYVVHVDYGIGTFSGFKTIEVKKSLQEVAVLTYQENSTLYVNVTSLHKLQKYSGKEGNAPRITKLGSGEWAKKKSRTRKKVKDIARELIELYAKRKAQQAHDFQPDTSWQKEMEARFEFEETPDQMAAIEAVKRDMESTQPMDRLVCGDVGFGKTEVAIRAAFKAVMDQKQVAILVPTTLLADQHVQTFQKRMEGFPIEIEVLSRFRSPGEQKKVIKRLKEGQVDILVGTHRIVSKDIEFKDLGLMVIDEEQRFGVQVKERLKELRASLDVLTLTATPIPRTLQFSLMGARDLSLIHTAPPNRQPVYTEIHSFNQDLIRDAILLEQSRGGQVFFIHNRVKNIEQMADVIRGLIPGIRVRHGHGQMQPARLERIIHDFYNHKFDVLVSTNIVENGIDIGNANTILINNANHFGLSELHQLRGRVGRSNRKAYCYLLTPPVQTLTSDARKRLMALEEFSDLGSGFNIAMRDLDIRGAGDILGAEQSGFINEIGFEMYTKILDEAVQEIKREEYGDQFETVPPAVEAPDTQVEFDLPALLPDDYVQDDVERLNLYRKLSNADKLEEIEEWKEEVRDRFGPLPDEATNLWLAAEIRLLASTLYLKKVTIRAGRIWLLCPRSDRPLGEHFYGSGLFQQLLQQIQESDGDNYQLIQKKEAVRIVLQEIPGLTEARDRLLDLQKALDIPVVQ